MISLVESSFKKRKKTEREKSNKKKKKTKKLSHDNKSKKRTRYFTHQNAPKYLEHPQAMDIGLEYAKPYLFLCFGGGYQGKIQRILLYQILLEVHPGYIPQFFS